MWLPRMDHKERGTHTIENWKKNEKSNTQKKDKKKKGFTVLPYVKGLGEKIKRILNQYDVNTAFKPVKTIRQELVVK